MKTARRLGIALLVAACAAAPALAHAPRQAADTLPSQLSDKDFWALSQDFSEENGFFQSDNLLSNELWYQTVIPELVQRTKPGGVYLGVGPEQNFTYIAAIKPKLVFITDIRRGNLWTQLMYKALFELSADRAEFYSRLFSKPRPDGLTATSTGADLVTKFSTVETSEALYNTNMKDMEDLLTKKHALPLPQSDLDGIFKNVYYYFYWYGPSINYSSSGQGSMGGRGGNFVSYGDLVAADDGAGANLGFLGSEETFQTIKALETKNMIVPFVGNFAGPKALRAEATWLKAHHATVSAFYLSNVEDYLTGNLWGLFCGNVAAMPLDASSTFIRTARGGGGGGGRGGSSLMTQLGAMQAETQGCGGGVAALAGR